MKQEFTFTREEIIKRNQDIADLINDYVNLYKEEIDAIVHVQIIILIPI